MAFRLDQNGPLAQPRSPRTRRPEPQEMLGEVHGPRTLFVGNVAITGGDSTPVPPLTLIETKWRSALVPIQYPKGRIDVSTLAPD